jgi:hypothetical protein
MDVSMVIYASMVHAILLAIDEEKEGTSSATNPPHPNPSCKPPNKIPHRERVMQMRLYFFLSFTFLTN